MKFLYIFIKTPSSIIKPNANNVLQTLEIRYPASGSIGEKLEIDKPKYPNDAIDKISKIFIEVGFIYLFSISLWLNIFSLIKTIEIDSFATYSDIPA